MSSTADQGAWDVAVVGGGVVGAATACALARAGQRVVLLEQLTPAHDQGSSHGDGRIIRYTYAESVYLQMAQRSFAAWAELEAAAGVRLVERTGSWECGPIGHPVLRDLGDSFERLGITYERLDAAASGGRFPLLELPPGSEAVYQADGGIVRAARAVQVFWKQAKAHGARTLSGVTIRHLDAGASGVRLRDTEGRAFRAGRLVLAAGGWTAPLVAQLGFTLPLKVTREVVAYFPPRGEADHGIGAMPTVIDYHGEHPFYALPQVDVPGVKAGWHRTGPEAVPGDRGEPDPEILPHLRRWVGARFRRLGDEPLEVMTCLYTNTPDYHFVLDRLPDMPRVVIGAGLSGHGFKFAPVIGEVLACLVLGQEPSVSTEMFSARRFATGRRSVPRSGA